MVRILHWLIRFIKSQLVRCLVLVAGIFRPVLSIPSKQFIRMVQSKALDWLFAGSAAVILGVDRVMTPCRQKQFILFRFSK